MSCGLAWRRWGKISTQRINRGNRNARQSVFHREMAQEPQGSRRPTRNRRPKVTDRPHTNREIPCGSPIPSDSTPPFHHVFRLPIPPLRVSSRKWVGNCPPMDTLRCTGTSHGTDTLTFPSALTATGAGVPGFTSPKPPSPSRAASYAPPLRFPHARSDLHPPGHPAGNGIITKI